MSEIKTETKTLDYSDVKYGILRINSGEIAHRLPTFYYPITIHDNQNNEDYTRHMHLSVRNRIDGFTKIYRSHNVVEGDFIIMELMKKEDENGKTRYILNVSFKKKENSDVGGIIREQEKNVFNNEELTDEEKIEQVINAIKDKIKIREYDFYKNETNVRAEIVERILEKLEWSFPELAREVKGDGNVKVDIALYDKPAEEPRTCKAIIEVKSIDVSFDKEDSKTQLKRYLDDPRFKSVKIGILTNGRTWIIYEYDRDKQELQEIQRTDIISNTTLENMSFFESLRIEKFGEQTTTGKQLPSKSEDTNPKRRKIVIRYTKDCINRGKSSTIFEKNATKTYQKFIEDHLNEVIKLREEKYFSTIVILNKDEYSKLKKLDKNKTKHFEKITGKNWYINVHFSTYHQLMLIKQIITEGNIEATAEYYTE